MQLRRAALVVLEQSAEALMADDVGGGNSGGWWRLCAGQQTVVFRLVWTFVKVVRQVHSMRWGSLPRRMRFSDLRYWTCLASSRSVEVARSRRKERMSPFTGAFSMTWCDSR